MSPRSVAELVTLAERGRRVKYLMFWGHQPSADGSIGPSCLSQWWQAPFTVDGVEFATAEHYMMWRKATLFGDAEVAQRILAVDHPQQAKGLGREVRGFSQAVWERERYAIVLAGSVAKFGQDEALGAYLLSTGERVLVEASPVDAIWGIGLSARDGDAWYPQRWRGLNLLGFALMEAREQLASG
ncbi:NADAR family protein [Catellatospora paridis]|uniref:NADAR family protein n=1 Tax=Catellatospora paridis TaxID=1617086 RepID=UPI0012D3F341|nr:NADAR family protein [Catellatospora paridis]